MPPKAKYTTIDEYLAGVTPEQRVAMEKLRKQIRAAAPKATECINYGVAAFDWHGTLVGFSASKNHLSFIPMTGHTVAAHAEELKGYETSKGAIRFTVEKPLPAALVKKLVKERMAENAAKAEKKRKR